MPKLGHGWRQLLEMLSLLFLMIGAGFLAWWHPWAQATAPADPAFLSAADSLQQDICQSDSVWQAQWKRTWRQRYGYRRPAERFPFNPNRVDSFSLYRMGYTPGQIHGILNYRRRGGVYRTADAFNRFGWRTAEDWQQIRPFVRLDSADVLTHYASDEKPNYPQKRDTMLDLNTADTSALKLLRGISSGYAAMIVHRRESLGGFVRVEQLREVLPEATYEQVRPHLQVQTLEIQKIPVNRCTIGCLRHHPYLTFEQARALYEQRRRLVTLHSLDDLRNLPEFTTQDLLRLAPYLDFQ